MILVNRFSEAPEEGIATKDILCLVDNTSVRVVEELEIEEQTFFDQQAFILNSQDQIREAESSEPDAEEQLHVRKSTRSRKGRKQDAFDCFLCDEHGDQLTRNTKRKLAHLQTSERLFSAGCFV